MKTLKIPGNKIRACSWEGNSLRIVIAIDSYIYFANMRPSYKWCYFNNTIVYSYTKPTKLEQCVTFFNMKTGEVIEAQIEKCLHLLIEYYFSKFDKNYLKYMKRLIGVCGGGDNCVLISQADDSAVNSSATTSTMTQSQKNIVQYALVLCNSIGTPLESKYIDIQPQFWSMNASYLVVASKSYFYLWNFQSMVDRNSLKKQTFEKLVFIDNPNASIQTKLDDPSIISVGSSVMVWLFISLTKIFFFLIY